MRGDTVTVAFCGDVMLGRGIDQILPHPGDPALQEEYVRDARAYVELAEAVNGPIPRRVDFCWPWGDALQTLGETTPDARVVNLETSVTRSDEFAPGKAVHYRMSPANLPCLAAAHPDVCALANNHVLDFGQRGLEETLDALAGAGLRTAGAGPDATTAQRPAVASVHGDRRLLVFSCGTASSGIPHGWAADGERPGVDFAARPSAATATQLAGRVRRLKRPGDIVIASIHWGPNWGYHIPPDEIGFAHALLDAGVDVLHGHSSHHPRPIEVYRGKLVLYGCGDFIDDYEGITGHEQYRDDLRLLYLVSLEADTGRLTDLRMAAFQSRRMRLESASGEDREWLRATIDRISSGFGSRVDSTREGPLTLRWS